MTSNTNISRSRAFKWLINDKKSFILILFTTTVKINPLTSEGT